MDHFNSELGKLSSYDRCYNPDRLISIQRSGQRSTLGLSANDSPPFFGADVWTHYEVSWLNPRGKPMVAVAVIIYDCSTPSIVESKSLKLYFNGLNNTSFESMGALEQIIKQDLSRCIASDVSVVLTGLEQTPCAIQSNFIGESLDGLDIACSVYTVEPEFLSTTEEYAQEVLYSDLLRSNCLVTGQPDWGSVSVAYHGRKINHEGLLKYLVSFRNHQEFHEHCIERIFMDISNRCSPTWLTVTGRYTRRGGLDINPTRSSSPIQLQKNIDLRLIRQ